MSVGLGVVSASEDETKSSCQKQRGCIVSLCGQHLVMPALCGVVDAGRCRSPHAPRSRTRFAMNFYQSFNAAMFFGIFAAVGTALYRGTPDLADHHLKIWVFACFLVLFRLKIFFDDHKYFGDPQTATASKTRSFQIGLLIGFVSWVLWLGASLNLSNLHESFYIAAWAIGVSTFWIVAAGFGAGFSREQQYWLVTNTALILLVWAAARRDAIPDDITQLVFLGSAIAIVLGDFILSKSIIVLET
jgi:hypothetical protein